MSSNAERIDQAISLFDSFLRTTSGSLNRTERATPGNKDDDDNPLSVEDKQEAARLMRVNHCGEVCAQALYQGQSLTARSPATRAALKTSAEEEQDHLYWTQQRITELGGNVSHLGPVFYGASFVAGALAGALGDRVNLGFVAATEAQVCRHLDEHIERLPEADQRSREILKTMRADEQHHKDTALQLGGQPFPKPVMQLMTRLSRVMTKSTYWI